MSSSPEQQSPWPVDALEDSRAQTPVAKRSPSPSKKGKAWSSATTTVSATNRWKSAANKAIQENKEKQEADGASTSGRDSEGVKKVLKQTWAALLQSPSFLKISGDKSEPGVSDDGFIQQSDDSYITINASGNMQTVGKKDAHKFTRTVTLGGRNIKTKPSKASPFEFWGPEFTKYRQRTKNYLRDFFGGITRNPFTLIVYLIITFLIVIWHNHPEAVGSSGKDPVSAPNFFVGLLFTLLAFLNGFRSNTAYSRWWEGRCLWGKHIYLSVDFIQKFGAHVPDRKLARRLADLVIEFGHFSRLLLRHQDTSGHIMDELMAYNGQLGAAELALFTQVDGWKAYTIITAMRNVIYQALHHDSFALYQMDRYITELSQCVGGCIRIRNSPLPKTYVLYLHVCTIVFCMLLPFTLVATLGWWTIMASALNLSMLLGIQGISEAMEEPFGMDDDDLKLDEFCLAIEQQVNSHLDWMIENEYDATATLIKIKVEGASTDGTPLGYMHQAAEDPSGKFRTGEKSKLMETKKLSTMDMRNRKSYEEREHGGDGISPQSFHPSISPQVVIRESASPGSEDKAVQQESFLFDEAAAPPST